MTPSCMTNIMLLPIIGGVTINHIPLIITYQVNDKTPSCMTNEMLLPIVGGYTIHYKFQHTVCS